MAILNENIEEKSITSILSGSFLDYSMSVIASRALPDVRDGLKPVHRRILYAMNDLGMTHKNPYKKSARIVGEVIGKYHPHGDSAVYETMVRLSQLWNMRNILIDIHGNNGSMEGDGAAAMRYTEARLSKLSSELLLNLKDDSVDFQDNYDETEREPVVLPARFPNLLVNGSEGIAVAMATKIPPHNLREVIAGTIALINDPTLTINDLMTYIKGPDFPTGAQIMGEDGIRQAYETGKGTMTVRSKVDVVTKKGKTKLVIREVPYQVNPKKLETEILKVQDDWKEYKEELKKNKAKTKPKGLDFMPDKGLKSLLSRKIRPGTVEIEINLKRDVNPELVLNYLYKHTSLQTTFSMNNLALVPRKNAKGETKLDPKVLNLKETLEEYIKHQIEVVTRVTQFELTKAEKKAHRIAGILKALDELDTTIETIRQASDTNEAKETLQTTLGIDLIQAEAILDMKLHRLTNLDQNKQRNEYNETMEIIKGLQTKLNDPELIKQDIKEELERISSTYGTDRYTHILPPAGVFNAEDLIVDDEVVVTITQKGFIKRTIESSYRTQRRKGFGVKGMKMEDDDFIRHLHVAKNKDTLLFFTNLGRVYEKKVYEIPESMSGAKGKNIKILLQLEPTETIQAVLAIREFSEEQNLVFVTRNGWVKKSKLSDYGNIRQNGIKAITLKEHDRLIGVSLTNGERNLTLVTKKGISITFEETDVKSVGRTGLGVKGISLQEKDHVIAFAVLEEGADLFIASNEGFGKRTPIEEFRVQNRGGKGVICMKPTDKNGYVVSAEVVQVEDVMMLMTKNGTLMKLKVNEISQFGRNTQGTKIINLRDGDELTAIARIPDEESDEVEEENEE